MPNLNTASAPITPSFPTDPVTPGLPTPPASATPPPPPASEPSSTPPADATPAAPPQDSAEAVRFPQEAEMEANITPFPDLSVPTPPPTSPTPEVSSPGVTASPINDAHLTELNQTTAAAATEAFRSAPEGSPLHRLGVATNLLQVLNSESLGPDQNQSLAAVDPEAAQVLGMRRLALEQEVEQLLQDEGVQTTLEGIRNEAMAEVFGADAESVIADQAAYLTGDAFHAEIAELPPEEQSARIATEMQRLTTLDPERAQQASIALVDRQIRENPEDFLRTMGRDETARALDTLLQNPNFMQELAGFSAGVNDTVKAASTANDMLNLMANHEIRTGVAEGLAGVMDTPAYRAAGNPGEQLAVLRNHAANLSDQELRTATENIITGLEASNALGNGLGHLSRGLAVVGAAARLSDGEATTEDYAHALSAGLGVTAAHWDDSRQLLSRLTGRNPAAAVAAEGAQRVGVEMLGPIGDAVLLPFDVMGAMQEHQNEDSVGTWSRGISAGASVAGIAAGIAVASGSTGIGAPVAVVASAVGIGAAVVDAAYGESDMTGQIRQDLRYLGISNAEEDTFHDLTTERRTINHRTTTRTVDVQLDPETIRQRAQNAPVEDRIALITQYIDGATSNQAERLVAGVIQDAAEDPEVFQTLIHNLPMDRIASELDRAEVGEVLNTLTRFSQQNNVPPEELMGDFVRSLAQDHRQGPLNDFLDQVPPEIYQALPAETLRSLTTHLMEGHTSQREENTIVDILRQASPAQYDAIVNGDANAAYRQQLHRELSGTQRRSIARVHGG